MAVPSVVNICNIALELIGEKAILTIDDNSKAARLCKRHYPEQRDILLRTHKWQFASARVALAPTATTPTFEWSYQFALPSDFLRLNELYEFTDPYELEGNFIYANSDTLYLKYGRKVEDPTKMDPLFRDALSKALARALAIPLADSRSTQKAMDTLLQDAISEAMFQGSIELDNQEIEADEWLNSRY